MLAGPVLRVAARVQKRGKLFRIAALASTASQTRAFTQPSSATKANVLDIPQNRIRGAQNASGVFNSQIRPRLRAQSTAGASASKLEEGRASVPTSGLNPIYLDAQVRFIRPQASFDGLPDPVLGYNPNGSSRARCHAPLLYGSLRKSAQQDACVWLGGRKGRRYGACGMAQALEPRITSAADIGSLFPLQHVAKLIGAEEKDIVFTSGATESNNMIIKGVARFHREKKKHIITVQTVHPPASIIEAITLLTASTGTQMRARLLPQAVGRRF